MYNFIISLVMDIVISAYDKRSSGISSYTLEVAKLLSKYFRKIYLLSFQNLEAPGIEVIHINLTNYYRALPVITFIKNREKIREILKNFDLVHETLPPWGNVVDNYITTKWGYVSYFKLSLIRLTGLSFPENLGAFPVTFQHYLMDKWSMKRAKFVIDVSRESPNFVPPPVELRPSKTYECSKKLRVLFVSRDLNMPRKNLKTLLKALKIINIPLELHLVGGGRVPKQSSHPIINHGFLSREEVISLMKEVDVLVLPSIYEELGYVGLEAYSVGLPVITSDIPSFRAVFKESPKFPPKDFRKLAKLMLSLDCESLEKIGKLSREYVAKSNEIARQKFLSIYKKFLSS
jgi:glycosyltransferase involved in cell wall biosynthesis